MIYVLSNDVSKDYLSFSKRCAFTFQKVAYCFAKGHILEPKRRPFDLQSHAHINLTD